MCRTFVTETEEVLKDHGRTCGPPDGLSVSGSYEVNRRSHFVIKVQQAGRQARRCLKDPRALVTTYVRTYVAAGTLAAFLGICNDIRICESRNACVTVSVRRLQTVAEPAASQPSPFSELGTATATAPGTNALSVSYHIYATRMSETDTREWAGDAAGFTFPAAATARVH
jgi:hypothetical protein